MKKLITTILLLTGLSLGAHAQYKAAFGVRFNGGPALTAKFATGNNEAAEALLSGFGNGLKGTLLYEWHNPAFGTNQWRWYYGLGAHLGASPDRNWRNDRPGPDGDFHVGADGILGIEHTFREIPLNISADWKPEFNFVNYTGLALPVFGASARLAF
ncbi:hypothetical protein [Jiulongibacter sp. NS-SX5]|uniref:hypothetical protein n=1 Tax=Jiulongibacter sp. NS-SX5 TaxID=3463854 RepID=UPI00405A303A